MLWNSTHSNATLRLISSRNISVWIRNAQPSARVCDSTCSTYDTLKTVLLLFLLLLLLLLLLLNSIIPTPTALLHTGNGYFMQRVHCVKSQNNQVLTLCISVVDGAGGLFRHIPWTTILTLVNSYLTISHTLEILCLLYRLFRQFILVPTRDLCGKNLFCQLYLSSVHCFHTCIHPPCLLLPHPHLSTQNHSHFLSNYMLTFSIHGANQYVTFYICWTDWDFCHKHIA